MNSNENKEKWQKIVSLLTEKCATEKIFQEKVEKAIEVLDYKKYKGEINKEYSMQFGSSQYIRPDFLISVSNKKLFVIEVKLSYKEKSSKQLFSYMRQLKLQCGILIAEDIKIFYDDDKDKPPILLKEIKLREDNIEGEKFVEVFQKKDKDKFFEEIKIYVEEALREKKAREQANMIKKITLNNIATYKQETTLETDKKINLIYGLNGTGKTTLSNYLASLNEEQETFDNEFKDCKIEGFNEDSQKNSCL